MRDALAGIKSGVKELREFGLTVGTVLVLLGGILLWRGKAPGPYLLAAGTVLTVLGLAAPGVLRPAQRLWMAIAVVIGFIMSRVVLTLLYYTVLTPIGAAMRLLGRDLLEERIDTGAATYWRPRPAGSRPAKSYENQY